MFGWSIVVALSFVAQNVAGGCRSMIMWRRGGGVIWIMEDA
jgi:hypothetical protein